MMPTPGDNVKVHYTGREAATGEEFDSSAGREPLEFMVGAGMVIPGFDAAVAALEVGGKTTVVIPAAEAYGPFYSEMVHEMPHDFFGEQLPEVGWGIQLQAENGQVIAATVTAITDEMVTLDLNHPLAGKDLEFDIELVSFEEGELPAFGHSCGCGDGGCGDSAEDDSCGCGSGCSC